MTRAPGRVNGDSTTVSGEHPRKVWSRQTERRIGIAVVMFVGVLALLIALAYWRLRG